ncbi:MAG: UvrD-helicase domain-containing protein [Myxococcales bacterium]|nr:UvrD-helicase domain-containing protein [Myxococcales bacterium]
MASLVLPDLHAALNPEQYQAATSTEGPLLVLAGAGSGKTRVLVCRIAHILATGRARPWQIMAVTFTNKAAGEMRSRLEAIVGPQAYEAWIGTFHALSARILRVDGHRLGYTPNFTIYDADDAKRTLKSLMVEMNIETSGHAVNVDRIGQEIERAKNVGWGPETFASKVGPQDSPARRLAKAVYFRYQEVLRQANAMDFGDLVRLATELLRHHPQTFKRFGQRFRYVMVDEFQDTNRVQYDFLLALTRDHHNLMVVGDDDQSIYRWRGAEVAHILGFEDQHPNAKVVKLEQNYRSSGYILAAANAVIAHNRTRHPKTLFTQAPLGSKLGLALLDDSQSEAALVVDDIRQRIVLGREPFEHAILYRMNAQSRLFEEALRRARIPYRLVGGTGFFERKEVKDIIAYLRLISNPHSRQDFERVVNLPPRGIGSKSIENLKGAAGARQGLDMLTVSDQQLLYAGLRATAIKKLRGFERIIRELSERAQTTRVVELVQQLLERIEYEKYLHKYDTATADDRMANVAELVNSIAEHEARILPSSDPDIPDTKSPLVLYLEEAALASGEKTEGDAQGVQLLTLHAAKGLEFPVVYLVGLEEKTFPSARVVDNTDPSAMEEERRLCYVGITRAMEQLQVTLARRRMIFGRTEVRMPSRFVGELPNEAVQTFGIGQPQNTPSYGDKPAEDLFGLEDDDAFDDDPNPFADAPAYQDDPSAYRDEPVSHNSLDTGPQPGTRAGHNTFGVGQVLKVEGTGSKARVSVRFKDGSTRTVIAKYLEFS